ncbi:MAG: hypothetical protein ABFD00_10195 [Chloroherpetonaceae bacterium]
MLKSFIIYSLDSRNANELFVEDFKDPDNTETINTFFCIFHTINEKY